MICVNRPDIFYLENKALSRNNFYQNRSLASIAINEKKLIKEKFTSITMWKERWFLSSNAKHTWTLYLIFALFAGLVCTFFPVLIRLELSVPWIQNIAGLPLYNNIITVHAIVIIFFMVMPALIGLFFDIKKYINTEVIKEIFIFFFYYIYTFITFYTLINMFTSISLINTILITFPFIWLLFFLHPILKKCIFYILGIIIFLLFIFLFVIGVQCLIVGLDIDIILRKVYPLVVSSLLVIPWIGFAINSFFSYTDKLVPFYKFVKKSFMYFSVSLFIIILCCFNQVICMFILVTYDYMFIWYSIFRMFVYLYDSICLWNEHGLEFIKNKKKKNSYFWQISSLFVCVPGKLFIWLYLPCVFNTFIIFTLFIFILAISMYLDNNFRLGKFIARLILYFIFVLIFIYFVNPFVLMPILEYLNSSIYNILESISEICFTTTYFDTGEKYVFFMEVSFKELNNFPEKPVQSSFIETVIVRDSFNNVNLEERINNIKGNYTQQEINKYLPYFKAQYNIITKNHMNNTYAYCDLFDEMSAFHHRSLRAHYSSNTDITPLSEMVKSYDIKFQKETYNGLPSEWFRVNTNRPEDYHKFIKEQVLFAKQRVESDKLQLRAVVKLLEGSNWLSMQELRQHNSGIELIKQNGYYSVMNRARNTVSIIELTTANKSKIITYLELEQKWLGTNRWTVSKEVFHREIGWTKKIK